MDKIILAGLIIVLLIMVIGLVWYIVYNNHKTYDELSEKYREKLEKDYKEVSKGYEEEVQKLQNIEKEIKEKEQFNQNLYKLREEELNRLIETKKKAELEKVDKEIEEWIVSAQGAATFNSSQIQQSLQEEINKKQKDLDELAAVIDDYKARRDVINQEILRARAIEEQQDFYRVQLSESSKEDITFLLSIIDRFNNKEVIYKLIWSEYIQKPFKSMMNRVLSGRDPKNVIYMIKNMNTNEIYIGKTKAEVSKRWTEHIKTSLNIGTISRTNIHKALFNNWDKFSFTVLEEVPSDVNLGEREKYYIKFYESDIFGYNIKSGG